MMKRLLRAAAIFLLIGVVSNVAVSRLCATYSYSHLKYRLLRTLSDEEMEHWGPGGDSEHRTIIFSGALGLYRTELYPDNQLGVPIDVPVTISAGWPRLSATGAVSLSRSGGGWYLDDPRGTLFVNDARALLALQTDGRFGAGRLALPPVLPMWPGFVFNTLFYALGSALVVYLLWFYPVQLRRQHRLRRRCCPECAYPMGAARMCSECGSLLPNRPDA